MATLQAFRNDILARTSLALFGPLAQGLGAPADGQAITVESRSPFGTDLLTRKTMLRQESIDGEFTVPVDPDDDISNMRPGEKTFQLRVWMREWLTTADANVRFQHCDVEIVVSRMVKFQDEETFYAREEMLEDQSLLLDPNEWRNLASVNELVDFPTIDAVPEWNQKVIQYTVAFSATVVPG